MARLISCSFHGCDEIRERIEADAILRGLLQQTLLLLDDFVVVGDRLRVRWMKRDGSAIEKTSTGFGTSADYFQLVRGETNSIEMRCVARDRFTLAVDERLFGCAVEADLKFTFEIFPSADDASYGGVAFAELQPFL